MEYRDNFRRNCLNHNSVDNKQIIKADKVTVNKAEVEKMTLDEAIKHAEEVALLNENTCKLKPNLDLKMHRECAEEHRQLAEWLKELRVFKSRKGQWLRMSDLSEHEDDRYKCSHCGNVIHYKDEMDLYTFNSWCGRCGSDNGRKRGIRNESI